MKKLLHSSIVIPVILACLIPLVEVYSQNSHAASLPAPVDTNLYSLPVYDYDYVPDFTYEEIEQRVKAMDTGMPFELNDRIFSFIQYFTVRNREYVKMVLARKDKFFPMFKRILDKHGIPTEIEYLSIIESGLDPQIRSRAGAVGLWQFMPATGRVYGMHVNHNVDDRMDPEHSTEAAAKYLGYLHRMFGNWELALAAYNCGPGNVRKAIRRSGGKKNFWDIYKYLPRETRGYVPQFQAMLYVLNHLEEHSLHLEEPTYPIEQEKIRFGKAFSLDRLAELTGICLAELEEINPSVKNKYIPSSHQNMAVRIPKSKAMFLQENLAWISDSLETAPKPLLASSLSTSGKKPNTANRISYKVRHGDVLGKIAMRHGVTVSQIKHWNGLNSSLIRPGQVLHIRSTMSSALAENSNGEKIYTVQPGDSLWIISQKHSLSVQQIKELNQLNSNKIKPGQKLIIG